MLPRHGGAIRDFRFGGWESWSISYRLTRKFHVSRIAIKPRNILPVWVMLNCDSNSNAVAMAYVDVKLFHNYIGAALPVFTRSRARVLLCSRHGTATRGFRFPSRGSWVFYIFFVTTVRHETQKRYRDLDHHCIALYRGVAFTNVTPVGLTWQENVAFGSIFPSDFPSNTSTRLYPLAWVIPRSVSFTETDAGPPPKPVLRNATAILPTGLRGRVQTCTEPIWKIVVNFCCVSFAGWAVVDFSCN